MAKNILLNAPQVSGAILRAQAAARMINTDRDTWSSQGESSIALDAFALEYAVIQSVIAQYQDLLLRDLAAADKVQREMIISDLGLGNLWK